MVTMFVRSVTVIVASVVATFTHGVAYADDIRQKQWHLRYLQVAQMHKIVRGEGVKVALIDTGVDAYHPDLTGQVLPGFDSLDSDSEDPDVRTDMDPTGHGTGMAGLIVARGRSGGALGIAPRAKLLPVRKGRGAAGTGVTVGNSTAIRWAMREGADVISISSGGTPKVEEASAINDALAAGIVVVAAVGNKPYVTRVAYPASHSGVLAVAGIDKTGTVASNSVTGPEVVIAAPSASITTTTPRSRGSYLTSDGGTSSATAIVAGAAALVRSRFPHLSGEQVVRRLTATADDKGPPGRDPQYGFGVLNIVRALTAEVPGESAPPTAPPAPQAGVPRPPGAGGPARHVGVAVAAAGCAVSAGGLLLALRRRRRGAR